MGHLAWSMELCSAETGDILPQQSGKGNSQELSSDPLHTHTHT